jgi:hypothetical protein
MKISPELLASLRAAINDTGGLIPHATMRNRWGALWRAVDSGRFDVNTLNRAGLNDDSIDTALRAIARELRKEEK